MSDMQIGDVLIATLGRGSVIATDTRRGSAYVSDSLGSPAGSVAVSDTLVGFVSIFDWRSDVTASQALLDDAGNMLFGDDNTPLADDTL